LTGFVDVNRKGERKKVPSHPFISPSFGKTSQSPEEVRWRIFGPQTPRVGERERFGKGGGGGRDNKNETSQIEKKGQGGNALKKQKKKENGRRGQNKINRTRISARVAILYTKRQKGLKTMETAANRPLGVTPTTPGSKERGVQGGKEIFENGKWENLGKKEKMGGKTAGTWEGEKKISQWFFWKPGNNASPQGKKNVAWLERKPKGGSTKER